MTQAVLWKAKCEDSWFTLTSLKGAALDGAHFEGAYLRDALDLELILAERMIGNDKTILPDDIQGALREKKKAQAAPQHKEIN